MRVLLHVLPPPILAASIIRMSIVAVPAAAQPGHWSGEVGFRGDRWPVRLHEAADGAVRIDLPDLLLAGEPVGSEREGDRWAVELPFGLGTVEMRPARGGWAGGRATGSGDTVSLALRRGAPPPYRMAEVRVPAGDVVLAGTLLVPDGPGPHPGAVVLHGSTVTERGRWEYRSWGDLLARRGVAALLLDRRGSGASGGAREDGDPPDLATLSGDARAAAAWLAARPEVDPGRVGLAGGSQAGWVAVAAAVGGGPVRWLLLHGAPGVTPAEQELQSVAHRLRADGLPEEEMAAALDHTRLALDAARTGEGWAALRASADAARGRLWSGAVLLPDAPDDLGWWRRNGAFDPLPSGARLAAPALLLYGEGDAVVPPAENAEALRRRLLAAGAPSVEVAVLPGADHGLELPAGRDAEGRWRFPRKAEGLFRAVDGWLARHLSASPSPSSSTSPVQPSASPARPRGR